MISICSSRFSRALVALAGSLLLTGYISARAAGADAKGSSAAVARVNEAPPAAPAPVGSAMAPTSAPPVTINFSNRGPEVIPRRASIVLIEADGVGYGDLSCYGQTHFQTPNLDRLAADGIRFTNYAPGEGGVVSQASVLFARDDKNLRLHPADAQAGVEALRTAGYQAGFFGEWTLGDENSEAAPWKKGFFEFVGYFNHEDAKKPYADYIFHYLPKSQFNETTREYETYEGREPLIQNAGGGAKLYIPDLLTKGAVNFIRNNRPDRVNHYRPFFLWLNYPIPGDGKISPPSDAPYSDEPWPQPEKNHAAMVSRLDGYVGQLRAQLLASGLTNNVVVLFTSRSIVKGTNGVAPGFFHSNAGTNDFRVPMIVAYGERVPTNQVNGLAWWARDILPTLVDIGYAKPLADAEGKSILPQIARKYRQPPAGK